MAITKLLAFEAEAEVLGRIHTVHYLDDELTISGLTLADAHAVLNALSSGKLTAVELPQGERVAPPHRNGNGHRDEPHPAVMAGAPLPEVVTAPAPVPPTPEAEFGDPSPAAVVPAEDDPFAAPAKPADPLPEWAGGTAPNPPTIRPTSVPRSDMPAGGPALPEELAKAKTVVAALAAVAVIEGCKDVDALIAAAVKLKDEVPALRVVVNLEDRIRRTVEAHPEKVWPAA